MITYTHGIVYLVDFEWDFSWTFNGILMELLM